MAIYRGPGGPGDATADADSEAALISTLVTQAETAATNAGTSATNASNSATSASNSATSASNSASAASSSASNASTSASNAASSASAASSSASSASTSATNAANSATAAAASYDSFDDRYLGAKSTEPTVDNDGDALITGALYFNSVDGKMYVWDGSEWDELAGAGGGSGTVTSVDMTVPTGLSVSGNPITTTGTLAVTYASGYAIPTTAKQTEWDTAYTDRLKWDGGATGLTASTGRTSLGATTLGSNLFTITNPGAITFPRFNADNTVSSLSASDFRTAIGAGTSSTTGTVTSVDISVPTGLSVSGNPITSSGTLALSYATGYAIPTTVKQSNWDDSYTFVSNFPTQTGNNGKYLTTDGNALSWATVSYTETDPVVGAINGIVKANGSGTISAATAGTDYLAPAAIGTTVQAYDSNLTTFVTNFTLPTLDGSAGQVLQTNGSGTLTFATPTGGGGITTGKAIAMAIVFG